MLEFIPWKPADTDVIARPEIEHDELRMLLFQQGTEIRWELRVECPCSKAVVVSKWDGDDVESSAGEPDPGCAQCGGTRFYLLQPQIIHATATSATHSEWFMRNWPDKVFGGIALTVHPEVPVSIDDRITLINEQRVFKERITSVGTVDSASYPILTTTLRMGSAVDQTEEVATDVSVVYCGYSDTDGGFVGEAVEGDDFSIVDGKIVWNQDSSNRPSAGATVTITYYCHPVYVVRTMPRAHRRNVDEKTVLRSNLVLLACWLEGYEPGTKALEV